MPDEVGAASEDVVRRWWGERHLEGSSFDAGSLAAGRNRTVSVVWPARNEADTIGDIVSAVRDELVRRHPLVDQLLVIDSGSHDATGDVARAAGASVHRQRDILPDVGDRPGKGEALWKSLAVATGDIVVFCDADLQQFTPQLLVGLIGPLLTDDALVFTKACYDRPLQVGEHIERFGGGRVTEMMARPLLNAWFPDLAGFVQPLAGEYAGRRDVLRSLPFAGRYGVDIALLIDIYREYGLNSMAQVDSGTRRHRHSSDTALGRMSAEIHHTVADRIQGTPVRSPALFQYQRTEDGFVASRHDVAPSNRPSMAMTLK